MKFKNRGMIEEEGIYHCGKKLEPVLSSMYLGIALQTTGTTFQCVTARCTVAIKAMSGIDNLEKSH